MFKLTIVQTFLAIISLISISYNDRALAQQAVRSPCPNAIKINTNYFYRGTLHFICLQATTSRPNLEVIRYNDRQVIWSKAVDDFGTNQLASFVDDEGILRILLAVPDRVNGTSMYSIDSYGKHLDETHTINTQYVMAMSLWKLELNLEWHLAIANQKYDYLVDGNLHNARARISEPKPMITIHSWRSTYFDSYQTINLPYDGHVNKLVPMHINDQEFLIVAMESNKQDNYQPGPQISSPLTDTIIYKLDFGDGNLNWVEYQQMGTNIALDASSFMISHKGSLKTDYYIVLLGQRSTRQVNYHNRPSINRPKMTVETHGYGLLIYKYLGDKFMHTTSMPVPGATKLDTITYGVGDSYVIIATLSDSSNQVNLYLFDGLDLKPVTGPFNNAPVQPPQLRSPYPWPRRAMGNLHLFRVPPPMDDSNDTLTKRTLIGAPQTMSMPALAFSNSDFSSIDGDDLGKSNNSQGSLYQIPVDEIIQNRDGGPSESSGPAKRNFIPTNNEQDLLSWCKTTINSILSDNFDASVKQLRALPRVDQAKPIELHGDLIVDGNLHVTNLLYAKEVKENTNGNLTDILDGRSPTNFSATFDAIESSHLQIDSIKRQVDQILVDDGSVQEVFKPLRFDRLVFDCASPMDRGSNILLNPFMGLACPRVGDIRTIYLNSYDISDIQRQALLTGRSMTIDRNVRFEHLVLRGSTKILDTLNGIRIDEIVFKNGLLTGPVNGHKTFKNGLYSTANLRVDKWDGFQVDRNTMLTSSGEQHIISDIKFSRVIIDSSIRQNYQNISSRIESLNSLNLDLHLNQIALSDTDNQFATPLVFEELILDGPVLFPAKSHLSSFDIENVWVNTLFKHWHQNVTVPIEFADDVHVFHGGEIIVNGQINGLHLSPGVLLMKNLNYSLPNQFVFHGDISANSLEFGRYGALNGIQSVYNEETHRFELAILFDGGTQLLSSDKIFNEVHLGGNTTISGHINGHLDLSQLHKLANNYGEPHRFASLRIVGHDIRFDDSVSVHIDAFINGVSTHELCSIANWAAQSPVTHYRRLKFNQPISFKSLSCSSINGFNSMMGSFLTKYGDQNVSGTLKLINGVVFNTSLYINSSFNGLDVAPLSRAISRAVSEGRTGHKEIFGDLFVDDIFANKINNLHLSNVFLAKSDAPQFIRAPMVFDHLDIENVLIVGKNLATNSFNNLNVTDVIANTLQYDSPQTILNHVELQTLHLMPQSNLLTKSFNGHELGRLYSDAVLHDTDQQIAAPKTFRGPVDIMDRVFLSIGIDGLSEQELRFNLLLQSDELIDDDLEFNHDITVMKELEIQSGIIDDIDIQSFVRSIISEKQPSMRIIDNSSIRFRDVKLNNLVVTGTIQGVDLSKDAYLREENINGSHDSWIRQQQIINNNQRLLNTLMDTGAPFQVTSYFRGANLSGTCHVHSCPRSTPPMPIPQPVPLKSSQVPFRPNPLGLMGNPQGILLPPGLNNSSNNRYTSSPPIQLQANYLPAWPPQVLNYPSMLPPRPLNLVDTSKMKPHWRPNYGIVTQPGPQTIIDQTTRIQENQFEEYALVDPKFLDHQAMLQAQAIRDLSYKVNKFLSISFYYEIVQKHPLLGPLLHVASNPIFDEKFSSLLLLKAISKPGEPCLLRGQSIAVMAQQRARLPYTMFTLNSRIQETSNPSLVSSLVVNEANYLFILDSQADSIVETMSQVLVYHWDHHSGMYELRERIAIDGFPTAMKSFAIGRVACIALANPKVVQGNNSGPPILYCQLSPKANFSHRLVLPMQNVFDLDIVTLEPSMKIAIAALSQQNTEQIGDLLVSTYDIATNSLNTIAIRRTVRPMKLHFIKRPPGMQFFQLVVSEAITSNDDTQALTRIFELRIMAAYSNAGQLVESQAIKDNQFYDIQSVLLDDGHSMLFLQSAHSISIYAPIVNSEDQQCDQQYALIQRLPTKGADKFLVFENDLAPINQTRSATPYGHLLVLSKEDCEHQQHSTVILRAKFR